MIEEKIVGGILGVVTGDALGLPVQFLSRAEVRQNPVTEMRGGGAFDMQAGSWSDDSSLSLCLMESLTKCGYDLRDIADRCVKWYRDGYMTPFGESFDIGGATSDAMENLIKGVSPLESGPADERDNGNGSLMRILPAAIYFAELPDQELIRKICDISKMTHGHPRSQLGCSLYAFFVKALLAGENPAAAYQTMRIKAPSIFKDTSLEHELQHYKRLTNNSLPELNDKEINSSGYVVDTLEAAIWCFLTTNSFKEALLRAVNLGLDTDTVGAVTGGLAGVYYGLAGIPIEWLSKISKIDEIMELSRKFANVVEG